MHPCPWICAPFIESHRSGPCKWWFMSQMVITQMVSLSDDGVTALHRARESFLLCDWLSHKGEKWSHLMKLVSYVHKLGWAWLIWIPPNGTIWLALPSDPFSILIAEKTGACGSLLSLYLCLLAGLMTWVPGTRMAEAENWFFQVILWILYACHGTFCMPPPMNTYIK